MSKVSVNSGHADKPHEVSTNDPHLVGLSSEILEAYEREHSMSFKTAFKLYPKAVAWSILLSFAIIMEGYDIVLTGTFYAQEAYTRKYGILSDGTYVIPASWKSALSNGVNCGSIIGLAINGIISERYGYRKTMFGALTALVGFIFLLFFAQNVEMLLAGSILCGIPWGIFQTLTTAYASEVCPVALRAYLCTYVNLCWVIGQFIASGVLRALLPLNNEWSYRIPYGLQWVWPIPLFVIAVLAPESPWWLVRKGRIEDAKQSLRRLTSREDTSFSVDAQVALICHTNELEKHFSEGTTYLDCFKGTDRRRTEIACVTWLIQSICGSSFMGYSTYFYTQAGLPTVASFDLTMGQYAMGMVGTLASWYSMSFFGRRTIYLYGAITLCGLLLIVGGLSFGTSPGAKWALPCMIMLFTFVYDSTIGPVCYSLVAELSSTRLRAKTLVLARGLYNVGSIIVNILTNYQFTPKPTGWGWGAKTGFFWAGSCLLCVIWIYFRLPEPKGRTYAELDILFERRIPARDFAKTELNSFEANAIDKLSEDAEVEIVEQVEVR